MSQFSFHFESEDFVRIKRNFQDKNGVVFNSDSEFLKEFFKDHMRKENLNSEGVKDVG